MFMYDPFNPNGASGSFLVLETLTPPRNLVQRVFQAFPTLEEVR